MATLAEKLAELKAALDAGLLEPDEFQREKRRLLEAFHGDAAPAPSPPPPPAEAGSIQQRVLDGFPYPVARVYADLDNPAVSWPNRRLALHFVVYQAMRTVGLALVGQYLYRPAPEATTSAHQRFLRNIAALRCPHFSDWIYLLNAAESSGRALGLDLFENLGGPGFMVGMRRLKETRRSLPSVLDPGGLRGGQGLELLEAFREVRNSVGHAGMLAEQSCRQVLQECRPWVDEVMEAFGFLERCRMVARAEDGPVVLRGAADPTPLAQPTDALLEALADSPVVLEVPGRGAQPMFPLFHAGLEGEPVHVYDGHFFRRAPGAGHKVIWYLGGGERIPWHEEDACGALEELLSRREITWELSRKETTPWRLQDGVLDYTARTLEELRGSSYLPECYLDRPSLSAPLRRFLLESAMDGDYPYRAFLLAGRAGSGKTSLLAHLASDMLEVGTPHLLLFLRGNAMKELEGWSDRILYSNLAHKVGVRAKDFGSLEELVGKLAAERVHDEVPDRRFLVFLDAVNEAPGAGQVLAEALEWVSSLRAHPWVRVVVGVRSEALPLLVGKREGGEENPFYRVRSLFVPPPDDRDLRPEDPPAWEVPPFTEEEAATVYRRYQEAAEGGGRAACRTAWEDLPGRAREGLLRVPLHLYLWMQTFANREAEAVAEPGDLFARFVEHLMARREGLPEALELLVGRWLEKGSSDLDDEDALEIRRGWQNRRGLADEALRHVITPLELLVSEGLLVKRVDEGGGYRVPFQRMREFLVFDRMRLEDPALTLETALRWAQPGRLVRRTRSETALTLDTSLRWAQRPVDGRRFPDYFGAFAFLLRRWAEDDRAADTAMLLSQVGLPEGLDKIAADTLARQVLGMPKGSRASRLDFLIRVVDCQVEDVTGTLHLMGLFLFDVDARLRGSIGQLELSGLLASVVSRLRHLRALQAEPDMQVLDYLWTGSTKLGRTLFDAGQGAEALDCFKSALTLAEDLRRRVPDSPRFLGFWSDSLEDLGEAFLAMGQEGEALECYEGAYSAREALHRRLPESRESVRAMWCSCCALGNFYRSHGIPDSALTYYERAVDIAEDLLRQAPESIESARDMGVSCGQLGQFLRVFGSSGRVRALLDRSLSIAEDLVRRDPESIRFKADLQVALGRLVEFLVGAGDLTNLQAICERMVAVSLELHHRVPDSIRYATNLLHAFGASADCRLAAGDVEAAMQLCLRTLDYAEPLRQKSPDSEELSRALGHCYGRYADVLKASQELDEAQLFLERSLAVSTGWHKRAPESNDWAWDTSLCHRHIGILSLEQGNHLKARTHYELCLQVLEELRTKAPGSVVYLTALYDILKRIAGLSSAPLGLLEHPDGRRWLRRGRDVLRDAAAKGASLDSAMLQELAWLDGLDLDRLQATGSPETSGQPPRSLFLDLRARVSKWFKPRGRKLPDPDPQDLKANPLALRAFAVRLLEEKARSDAAFANPDPATRTEVLDDLESRLEAAIKRRMIYSLPPEAMEEFESLLDQDAPDEMVQRFLQERVPGLTEVVAESLMDFRKSYLAS